MRFLRLDRAQGEDMLFPYAAMPDEVVTKWRNEGYLSDYKRNLTDI